MAHLHFQHAMRFENLSCSWVAIHPNPIGVIQFVGGAFYGTLPTVNYRYFLERLFSAGYTIVALPFRFTFRHWSVALQLLEEHYRVRQAMIEAIHHQPEKQNYSYELYLKSASYSWVGHSLGCKYIILLEILNDGLEQVRTNMANIGVDRSQFLEIQDGLARTARTLHEIQHSIQQWTQRSVDFDQPSIHNEASLLIAPVIADLNAAIPLHSLKRGFERIGLQVLPTIQQTYDLIAQSDSFNLTEVIRFKDDTVARSTCDYFANKLQHKRMTEVTGKHLEPIGVQIGDRVADFNPLDKFVQPIAVRQLETIALTKLKELQKMPVPIMV